MPGESGDDRIAAAVLRRRGRDPDVSHERAFAGGLEVVLRVPEDLDVWPGHFPDFFVVPGVLQLDWIMRVALDRLGIERLDVIDVMKFVRPIRPGEDCTLTLALDPRRSVLSFRMEHAGVAFSSGRLRVTVSDP